MFFPRTYRLLCSAPSSINRAGELSAAGPYKSPQLTRGCMMVVRCARIWLAAVLSLILAPTWALAASPAENELPVRIAIERQEASAALREFSRQAGVQTLSPYDDVHDITLGP